MLPSVKSAGTGATAETGTTRTGTTEGPLRILINKVLHAAVHVYTSLASSFSYHILSAAATPILPTHHDSSTFVP